MLSRKISRTHAHAFHACGYGTERDNTILYNIDNILHRDPYFVVLLGSYSYSG